MTQTVTGLFDNYDDAERAVNALESAGVSHDNISIVANNARGNHVVPDAASPVAHDAGTGARVGAAVGGAGGLLAGLGLLVIPGLGPVVAAGWLGATLIGALGGAAIGGAAGGLVGALTDAGVPVDDAHVYAEGVRRGGSLVTAKVDDSQISTARSILADHRNVDVSERRNAYRQEGWNGFDEKAPAYDARTVSADA
ncbi:MAG: general stress protein [Sphingomonas sp.]